jgi:plasmid stabilization system protein ParE
MADVLITAGADQDYVETLCWYAQHSPRAANGFEAEVERALKAIGEDPRRYPMCDKQHRFYLMRKYLFQVIYREVFQGILVVAIAHAKRRPGYLAR